MHGRHGAQAAPCLLVIALLAEHRHFPPVSHVPAPARFRAGAGTVPTYYIAPSTALTNSSTAVAESYSPLKWAVTTS